jgi:excisionase family DNA binding protein
VKAAITRQTRFDDLPDFLSVEETRAYLALGRSTLYELIRSKALASVRFGRVIRIPRAALERYLCGEHALRDNPQGAGKVARRQDAPDRGVHGKSITSHTP